MSSPSAAFHRTTSVRPSGCLGPPVFAWLTRTGAHRSAGVMNASGASLADCTLKPIALLLRFRLAPNTESPVLTSFGAPPSSGRRHELRDGMPRFLSHIHLPSADQPIVPGCSSKVTARARDSPPCAGTTITRRVNPHVGGSSLTTQEIHFPSGEKRGSVLCSAASRSGLIAEVATSTIEMSARVQSSAFRVGTCEKTTVFPSGDQSHAASPPPTQNWPLVTWRGSRLPCPSLTTRDHPEVGHLDVLVYDPGIVLGLFVLLLLFGLRIRHGDRRSVCRPGTNRSCGRRS